MIAKTGIPAGDGSSALNDLVHRSHLKFFSRLSAAKAARSYWIESLGDSHKARAPCASR
jgi:hypothetical protein